MLGVDYDVRRALSARGRGTLWREEHRFRRPSGEEAARYVARRAMTTTLNASQ